MSKTKIKRWKDKWLNPEKINKDLKKGSGWVNAQTKHIIEKVKTSKPSIKDWWSKKPDLSFKEGRKRLSKDAVEALQKNVNVIQITNNAKKLFEGNNFASKIMKISGTKWGRRGLIGAGVTLGLLMLEKTINHFESEEVIPKQWDRGYDVMNETMTDFGSPTHLHKTASKTITPYYSSIRKGTITSTNAVMNSNPALFMSKHAIGHTRY